MFNKILNIIVKTAGAIVSAPVTWLVAGQLFHDVNPIAIRYLVQLSGVLLVEGVFLANWLALENDKNAPPEIKTRYALTALALYGGLWLLAIYHGEGIAGIVFRAALGAALIGSGWDTYFTTWQKMTARADKDISTVPKVRRNARKMATENAIAEDKAAAQLAATKRQSMVQVETERIRLETERALMGLRKEDKAERQKEANVEASRGEFPFPVDKARAIRDSKQRLSRSRIDDTLVAALAANPAVTQTELAAMIGKSRQAVGLYLAELADKGRLEKVAEGKYIVPTLAA